MLGVAVLVVCAAVWGVSETQRKAAERVFAQSQAADRMLTAMLDQETGLRGFAISRDEAFLQPYVRGAEQFDAAVRDVRRLVDDEGQQATIFSLLREARRWQELADDGIVQVRRDGRLDQRSIVQRKQVFDEFRRQDDEFKDELTRERDRELDRAGTTSVIVIAALGLLFGGFGYVVIERETRRRRERRRIDAEYRRTQSEFAETMQVMRDEPEALIARVSGSGGTCFALCDDDIAAESLAERIEALAPNWWVKRCRLGGPWD